MAPKVAIIFYSMYGHIKQLADAEKKGIEEAGGQADVFQIPETLPDEVLSILHAPGQDKSVQVLSDVQDLAKYDAFLFGIPTRYGNFPGQWKAFWDQTGQLWMQGALTGKFAGLFISSGTLGGGQESTALASISTLAHHGLIYVPLGYKHAMSLLMDIEKVRGGSPWGAGTFTGPTGARQPSAEELELAKIQGKSFYETVAKVNFS